MSFDSEGFAETGTGSGTIRVDMGGGFVDETPYDATFYLNAAGTVAAASADAGGVTKWMFLSKTGSGDVVTTSGRQTSAADVEGTLLNSVASEDRDELLAGHLEQAGGAVADPGLKDAIAEAPQRSADLAVKLMQQMMAQFSG